MTELLRLALKALNGVGDAALGEWGEEGQRAYHLRRRLSAEEAKSTGQPLDIRGTKEGELRFESVSRFIPAHLRDWCRMELNPR